MIDRFSEDIDLTLDTSHFYQSSKRSANKAVLSVCDALAFKVTNREQLENHSHGSYNCYNIRYPVSFSHSGIDPFIKLEMVFIQKAYPDEVRSICSMVGEYLESIGRSDIYTAFDLKPYRIKVQSLERTLIDKVFAICDYYLRDEPLRQSRHIYDIYKLIRVVDVESLSELIPEVRKDRMKNRLCISARPEIDIPKTLQTIVTEQYFRKDYESITESLLTRKITYEHAITAITEIAEAGIFGDRTLSIL